MSWNAENAVFILTTYENCYSILAKKKGLDALKKTYRFQFGSGSKRKHIAISRERNEGAVSAYVNAQSSSAS